MLLCSLLLFITLVGAEKNGFPEFAITTVEKKGERKGDIGKDVILPRYSKLGKHERDREAVLLKDVHIDENGDVVGTSTSASDFSRLLNKADKDILFYIPGQTPFSSQVFSHCSRLGTSINVTTVPCIYPTVTSEVEKFVLPFPFPLQQKEVKEKG